MAGSPTNLARTRYAQAFTSNIFEPGPPTWPTSPITPSAGRRRDQASSITFSDYGDDKEEVKTPEKPSLSKDDSDSITAKQRKLQFLSSESNPLSAAQHQPSSATRDPVEARPVFGSGMTSTGPGQRSRPFRGRETPSTVSDQGYPRDAQLFPQDLPGQLGQQDTPQGQSPSEALLRRGNHRLSQQEVQSELVKRQNLHYSDLFDRGMPNDLSPTKANGSIRRPRLRSAQEEDQIVLNQDWTDSKTEFMSRARAFRPEQPAARKKDELHQSRVLGGTNSWQSTSSKVDSVTHDNSGKLRSTLGQSPQKIHQAHLRTSLTPEEFYQEAEETKHWEVTELYLYRLPSNADDAYVRSLCQGFDLQIVKVATEIDPVRNLCKGRSRVMVRYNPRRDSIEGLVRKLQEHSRQEEGMARDFCRLLGLQRPICQAPMAGGPSTVPMAVATAKHGGLAAIAVQGLRGKEVQERLQQFAAQVPRRANGVLPVVVNFFTPTVYASAPAQRAGLKLGPDQLGRALGHQAVLHRSLSGDLGEAASSRDVDVDQINGAWDAALSAYQECFSAALAAQPLAFSFVFGPPSQEEIAAARQHGIRLMATATSKAEALALAEAGMDAVIVQGREAGGHRSTFVAPTDPASAQAQLLGALSTCELLREVRSALPNLPLVAAGGLGTRASLEAVWESGADAVQLGTALLLTKESGCSPAYKEALRTHCRTRSPVFTRAFSGRWARGLHNIASETASDSNTLPFPFQLAVAGTVRRAAGEKAKQGALLEAAEYINLWAGDGLAQAVEMYEGKSTGEVIEIVSGMLETSICSRL